MLKPVLDMLCALNKSAEEELLADLRLLHVQRLQMFKDIS